MYPRRVKFPGNIYISMVPTWLQCLGCVLVLTTVACLNTAKNYPSSQYLQPNLASPLHRIFHSFHNSTVHCGQVKRLWAVCKREHLLLVIWLGFQFKSLTTFQPRVRPPWSGMGWIPATTQSLKNVEAMPYFKTLKCRKKWTNFLPRKS